MRHQKESSMAKRTVTWGHRIVILLGAAGISGLLAGAALREAAPESPVAGLVKLGLKFDGAKTCSAATCHGGTEPGKSPHGLNTFTLWDGKDPHRKAWDTLGKDESKKIAAALKIDNAATSERCLSCHATNVPANLQGEQFNIEEGNSCTTCHGPTEKWRSEHAKEGWLAGQRTSTGSHEKLLAATGVYDTQPLIERAVRCTGCHLAIEPELVKAGHPVPAFDLDYYSNPGVYTDRHWKDGSEAYFNTHQWAAGQIVCLSGAFKQVAVRASGGGAAEDVKQAAEQAMGHLMVVKHFVTAMGGDASAVSKAGEAVAAAVEKADMAGAASAATAGAAAADGLKGAIAGLKADKAMTMKTLAAISGDAGLTKLGIHGVEQQAYGVYALYNAYAISEKVADAESGPVNDAIGKLFDPLAKETRGKMDGYDDALKAVVAKLPK
jgi:Cytochrome c554 and c-prime